MKRIEVRKISEEFCEDKFRVIIFFDEDVSQVEWALEYEDLLPIAKMLLKIYKGERFIDKRTGSEIKGKTAQTLAKNLKHHC